MKMVINVIIILNEPDRHVTEAATTAQAQGCSLRISLFPHLFTEVAATAQAQGQPPQASNLAALIKEISWTSKAHDRSLWCVFGFGEAPMASALQQTKRSHEQKVLKLRVYNQRPANLGAFLHANVKPSALLLLRMDMGPTGLEEGIIQVRVRVRVRVRA